MKFIKRLFNSQKSSPPKLVIKEIEDPYSNEPQVWGFLIQHIRATDIVYFGPFRTLDEVREWDETIGQKNRVAGAALPLMNPYGDPNHFWWLSNDATWEELLKPKKDRGYMP